MKQKFLILEYSFHGKFKDDENGPANLKICIGLSLVMKKVVYSDQKGLNRVTTETMQEGPLVYASFDTLEECEKYLKEDKSGKSLFVLPVFEIK